MFWKRIDAHTRIWLVFLFAFFLLSIYSSAIANLTQPIHPLFLAIVIVLTFLFRYQAVAAQMAGTALSFLWFLSLDLFTLPIGLKICNETCFSASVFKWLFQNLQETALFAPLVFLFSVLLWLLSSELSTRMNKERTVKKKVKR